MTNYEIKMPANYAAIDAEEMTYLVGGETTGWQMFKDVGAEAPFNGGHGEAAFKSFMSDAMAKQVTKAGGVGLSDRVAQEMLKLQGLS